ncbi:MAG: alpha/beta hydrolase [Gammaproteobacteria bacterium]|nr:alpha/beta hydrolase [Gammaproteobacteria bacterium]
MKYEDSNSPAWFIQAVNTPYQDKFIEVEGCKIHYQHWDNEGKKPGLLFVHGGGAHSHWWDFIAPSFLADYDVTAIDISGMGASEHRDSYQMDMFAKEIIAVCDDAGYGNDTIVAAHSYGGLGTLQAALNYPDRLKGIVVVDSAIFPPNFQGSNDMKGTPFKNKKVYPDLETALTRFKLVPPQPCENDYILKFIARTSIGEVEGGWSWKFDMEFLQKTEVNKLADNVKDISIQTTVMYGEKSMLFMPAMMEFMRATYKEEVPFIMLPDARHHLFLDKPLEFIELFRETLNTYN